MTESPTSTVPSTSSQPSTTGRGGFSGVVVHRPVTTAMVTLALLLFGLVALLRMPVELLPDLSYPSLTVQTTYPDTVPAEVEDLITRPIEEVVGGVPGVIAVESVSREGTSEVVLNFAWGTPIDRALADVREKLDRVRLPQGVAPPIVLRYDPSQEPIVKLSLSGGEGTQTEILRQLRTTSEYFLKRELEKIPGVAAVSLQGGYEEEVRVELDPQRLVALKLSAQDIITAIQQDHVSRPGGTVWDGNDSFVVRTVHEAQNPKELGALIVRSQDGAQLRLRDVAKIWRGTIEREEAFLVGTDEAVQLSVYREGDANIVSVANAVTSQIEGLSAKLAPGQSLTLLGDQSTFIEAAVDEVILNTAVGGALAVLVLLFFLRNLRSTLIIALAIPLSLLVTFIPLKSLGVSLNLMSLGGLALGVGMLVDNSIVALESIARIREENPQLSRKYAAVRGASEIASSVVASTLTTVAVFLPMAFVEGVAGQLVHDLSLSVSISILSSMFVALSVVPVLESLGGDASFKAPTGQPNSKNPPAFILTAIVFFPAVLWKLTQFVIGVASRVLGTLASPLARSYEAIEATYPGILKFALHRRLLVLGITISLCAVGVMRTDSLAKTLVPSVHQGEFYVEIRHAPGTALEKTTKTATALTQLASQNDDVTLIYGRLGSISLGGSASGSLKGQHLAQLHLKLDPAAQDRFELVEQTILDSLHRSLHGEEIIVRSGRPELLSFEAPLELRVFSDDLENAIGYAKSIAPSLRQLEELSEVVPDEMAGRPEVRVLFDRQRLARAGLTVSQAATAVQRSIQGEIAGTMQMPDKQLNIRVQLPRTSRGNASDVAQIQVGMVEDKPLVVQSVAHVEPAFGPSEIRRIDGRRGFRVRAQISGQDLDEASNAIQSVIDDDPPPPGVHTVIGGQAEEMERSMVSLSLTALLSFFLVYVVMASSFESLHHPFLIMFTVPMAITGVLFSNVILGLPLSAMTGIGTIILGGIVVNNAIVFIAAVNHRRGNGQDVKTALLEAGRTRVRPILMTTTTTILGLLPMALGLGEGAALRQPLAVAVIGGLAFATPLTLLLIPTVYSLFPGKRRDAWSTQPETVPEAQDGA